MTVWTWAAELQWYL